MNVSRLFQTRSILVLTADINVATSKTSDKRRIAPVNDKADEWRSTLLKKLLPYQ
jgi:hypothetical protein